MIVVLMGKVMQMKTRLFYNVEYILLGETTLPLRVPTPPQLGVRPPPPHITITINPLHLKHHNEKGLL